MCVCGGVCLCADTHRQNACVCVILGLFFSVFFFFHEHIAHAVNEGFRGIWGTFRVISNWQSPKLLSSLTLSA